MEYIKIPPFILIIIYYNSVSKDDVYNFLNSCF